MTVANKERIRSAIINLYTLGQAEDALTVWDLLDSYNALEAELDFHADNSPAVQDIEALISGSADCSLGQSSSEALRRCDSYFLSEKHEELVRCQGFMGHIERTPKEVHYYEIDGESEELALEWHDKDAYGFEAFKPKQRTGQAEKDASGNLIFPGQTTVEDHLNSHGN